MAHTTKTTTYAVLPQVDTYRSDATVWPASLHVDRETAMRRAEAWGTDAIVIEPGDSLGPWTGHWLDGARATFDDAEATMGKADR